MEQIHRQKPWGKHSLPQSHLHWYPSALSKGKGRLPQLLLYSIPSFEIISFPVLNLYPTRSLGLQHSDWSYFCTTRKMRPLNEIICGFSHSPFYLTLFYHSPLYLTLFYFIKCATLYKMNKGLKWCERMYIIY